MKEIFITTGDIEISNYFCKHIRIGLDELGYKTYDYNPYKDFEKLTNQLKQGSIVLCFNFGGLKGKEEEKLNEMFHLKYINIIMDHPMYFRRSLKTIVDNNDTENYYQINIDRKHDAFMKKYYPTIKSNFIPLGGSCISPEKPEKKYDICLTGNLQGPGDLDFHLSSLVAKDFFSYVYSVEMAKTMDKNLSMTIEEAYEYIFGNDDNIQWNLYDFQSVDSALRAKYRAGAVEALLKAGYDVHVCGNGWSKMENIYKGNMIIHTGMDSHDCLQLMRDSRITLNVMPWFKDGAHDRVFGACASQSLALTDDSIYLREIFTNDENIAFFDLAHYEEQLPAIVDDYLSNPEKLERVTQAGYELTMANHTWEKRAIEIDKIIKEM